MGRVKGKHLKVAARQIDGISSIKGLDFKGAKELLKKAGLMKGSKKEMNKL